jgi:hypothetical protein
VQAAADTFAQKPAGLPTFADSVPLIVAGMLLAESPFRRN